jgi:signal transduction histidine kinase
MKNHTLQGTAVLLLRAGTLTAGKALESKLEKIGLESHSFVLGAALEIPAELEQGFSQKLSLVFLCGDYSAEEAKSLFDRLRAFSGAFKFVPLFLVAESVPAECGAFIDDVFSVQEAQQRLAPRLQLKLQQAKQRAEAWQKQRDLQVELAKKETALKQREEFLGVCAHDLRSPLGLVQSSIGLLLNSPEHAKSLTAFQKELLTRAERQARQAIHLVKDLLDVTSLDQGLKPHYQLLNLDSVLEEFYRDYAFQAQQKNVHFHYQNDIRSWRVLGDADRVRQLLQNLFTNALKFTEPGKNIFLEVISFQGRRKTDPPYPMVIISLRDEGPGIPKDEIQKIFDRFNQIKEYSRTEGRGLGLSVAKQISQLHDGNVWAESEQGQGSTFRVLFPHVISRAKADALQFPPKKVLVVEPNNVIRQNQYQKLRDWGHQVVFAKDGVEAVTFAFHEWPDLIVLPPELTKISAPEVTRMLKSDPIGGGTPVLLALPPGRTTGLDAYVVDGVLQLPLTDKVWKEVLQKLQDASSETRKKKRAA